MRPRLLHLWMYIYPCFRPESTKCGVSIQKLRQVAELPLYFVQKRRQAVRRLRQIKARGRECGYDQGIVWRIEISEAQ